jgi:hypothetical protein
MSETPESEPEQSNYARLPLPVVAVGLFALLAVLLALGLYANANLRSRGVVAPVLAPTTTATAPPSSTAAIVAPGALVSTPTTVTSTALAAPTAAPTQTATVAVSPANQVVTGNATIRPVTVEVATPSSLATVDANLAVEVGSAYENFWQVRSQAELTLDASHAADVMDGGYLEHFLDVVSQLSQERRAIKTHVMLNYMVVKTTGDVAFVHDHIEDTSYYVDPDSGAELSDPVDDVVSIEFKLQSVNGTWKVVDSVTQN